MTENEKDRKEDLIILFSGGADSTLLLKFAKSIGRVPLAIMIDYNQLHIQELEYAKKFLDQNKISNMTVKIDGYHVNSGLTGNGKKGTYDGVSEFNVPGRNTIFLSIAYGIAESEDIGEIWFGANQSDYENLFPDCSQEYIERMNMVLSIASSKPIKIKAPLLGCDRYIVNELLKKYDIDKSELFSGYGKL